MKRQNSVLLVIAEKYNGERQIRYCGFLNAARHHAEEQILIPGTRRVRIARLVSELGEPSMAVRTLNREVADAGTSQE